MFNNSSRNSDESSHRNVIFKFNDTSDFIKSRTSKGLTQSDVANMLGYPNTSAIIDFEAGKRSVDSRGQTLFCLITNTHPYYQLRQSGGSIGKLLISAPDGLEIKQARLNACNMTQAKMAKLLGLSSKTLISNYENNRKKPTIQNWTLFLLITCQHPYYSLEPK